MTEPITWRSIRGPSLAEASRPLEAAQQSITGAFDKFASMLREREAVNQGVLDRDNEAKVQTFLDRLQGAATPEQVAALKASGELDTLRAALKPADLARVRGAEEARTTALRQGIVAENVFSDQIQARQRAPLINEAKMFVANNDRAGLQSFLAKHDLGDEATFLTQLNAAEQAKKEFGWKEGNQKHVEALRPLDLQSRRLGIEASQEQAAASKEQRELAVEQRAAAKAAAGAQAQAQLLKDTGNVYAEGIFTPEKSQELLELMKNLEIGDDVGERQAVIKRLTKVADQELEYWDEATKSTKKVTVPVPMSLAKQAILGSQDQMFNRWNQGYANSMEDNLRKAMRQNIEMNDATGKPIGQNKAVFDFQQYMESLQRKSENPVPASTKKSR